MLSVFLTEELERHTTGIESAELVFLFCSAQDEKRNTAVAVLRGLVHQIVVKRPQLVKHALPFFETPERSQQTLSSLEALWIIFSRLVVDNELGTMFCVLDGLDECEESTLRVLLPRIVSLLAGEAPSSSQAMFKLAIVSRDISGLQGCKRIRLDPDNDEKVVSDIELFVSARVEELSRIEGCDDDFRSSVQTALLERAEGTFLWVGFAMYELLQKQTCSEIWEAFEDLPSGLPSIYSRMLLRIPEGRRELSRAILRWVTLAARPLQLQELAAATDVRPFSSRLTIDQATRDAIALCGPLLKVQEREVSLVHQSARDYLLRTERDSDKVLEAFRLVSEPSHLELAQKCLSCITQSDLQHKAIDLDTELDPQDSPLLRYATLHWPEHAKSCYTLAAELFNRFGLFLQNKSPLRDYWWATYDNEVSGCQREPLPLLHMACDLGIVPWVEAVLARTSRWPEYHKCVNGKNNDGETALYFAVRGGNEAVVWLLVDHGADVRAKDNDGRTVLHRAAVRGNKAVVWLLVERGANVEAKGNDGRSVLHWAAAGGNEAVVRLLVERGADVNAKDNDGKTVLHWAAWGGNKAVVRLLVERGVDINAIDNDGKTVLHSAAEGGNEATVWLLVDLGANIDAKDRDGKTMLHQAAWREDKRMMRLLADLGANINAKDRDGKTMLHRAAEGGNEAVVRLLVDHGADINTKDRNGETVLYQAAEVGNEAVVRMLVERGVDVNAKDNDGYIVLHSAAWRENKRMMRLLVGLGANVNAKDRDGKAMLHWAAEGGNEAVVRLLVDHGADINTKDRNGETVLHQAAEVGNEAVVRMLVERGVDVNAKDNDGYTVLHSAAVGGSEAVVQLLVEKGADVRAKDNDGDTVLHSAAWGENEVVVQLLVDLGADVKAKGNDGRTVLHWAAAGEKEAVVRLLVDLGADVKAKDNRGRTAI